MSRTRFAVLSLPLALAACIVPGAAGARDRNPSSDVHPELVLETAHTGEVRCIAFSPDGTRIASGSADGTIKLWDSRSGELLRTLLGHARGVSSVAFLPDGATLASAGGDRAVRIWDLATGAARRTLAGHARYVSALAVSPDGTLVATAGGTVEGTEARDEVFLWDARSGERRRTLPVDGLVHSLAFSRAGDTLFAGGSRVEAGKSVAVLRTWDVRSGVANRSVVINGPSIQSVALSPGATMAAAGTADGTTWIWETDTGRVRHHLGGLLRAVNAVAFTPDSRMVAAAGEEGTILLWDAFTGKLNRKIRARGSRTALTSLALSPDGTQIVGGTRDEEEIRGHDALSGGVDLWATRSGSLKWSQIGHGVAVNSVSLSPDEQLLATGGSDGPVRLWYLRELAVGRLREPHSPPSRIGVPCVAFSPDRKLLANTRADDTVEVWDVRTGRLQERLSGEMKQLGPVLFSPDGRELACGGKLGQQVVIVWNTRTGEVDHRQLGPNQVLSLAFSPSGQWLAAGSNRGARVWDASTGQERHALDPYATAAAAVAYSRDGRWLATAIGSSVTLWDAVTGERRRTLGGHTDEVLALAFSPDGKTLASGGWDRGIRVWDVETGLPLGVVSGHTGPVTSLAFAADGTLISGSQDGTVRYWDARGARLLATLLLLPPKDEGEIATRWIAFTPEGYYAGSSGDDRFLRWRENGRLYSVTRYAHQFRKNEPLRRVVLRRP